MTGSTEVLVVGAGPTGLTLAAQLATQDGAAVTATLRHRDGGEVTVQASYVVGCDGAHSDVRAGIGFAGGTDLTGLAAYLRRWLTMGNAHA